MEEVDNKEQDTVTYGVWTFKIENGKKYNVAVNCQHLELIIQRAWKMANYLFMVVNVSKTLIA